MPSLHGVCSQCITLGTVSVSSSPAVAHKFGKSRVDRATTRADRYAAAWQRRQNEHRTSKCHHEIKNRLLDVVNNYCYVRLKPVWVK